MLTSPAARVTQGTCQQLVDLEIWTRTSITTGYAKFKLETMFSLNTELIIAGEQAGFHGLLHEDFRN